MGDSWKRFVRLGIQTQTRFDATSSALSLLRALDAYFSSSFLALAHCSKPVTHYQQVQRIRPLSFSTWQRGSSFPFRLVFRAPLSRRLLRCRFARLRDSLCTARAWNKFWMDQFRTCTRYRFQLELIVNSPIETIVSTLAPPFPPFSPCS